MQVGIAFLAQGNQVAKLWLFFPSESNFTLFAGFSQLIQVIGTQEQHHWWPTAEPSH